MQAHKGSEADEECLATERLIASRVLTRVYDASPIVRAEVALVLARLCSGHSDLFQVLFQRAPPLPIFQVPIAFADWVIMICQWRICVPL